MRYFRIHFPNIPESWDPRVVCLQQPIAETPTVTRVFFYTFATTAIVMLTTGRRLKAILERNSHHNYARLEKSHRLLFEQKYGV